ncbi:uncharacterized protein [Leptinotarsa decemlineata]|uniref:uncharacterized protein n=1 Tax=Leptinotarsa decemlineata TaxID=7539 RepID=UPI003D3086A8
MDILWSLLLLGTVAFPVTSPYKIETINNTVGVYYHEKGNIILTNDKWTLLVSKNISQIKEAFDNNVKILDSLIGMTSIYGQSMSTFRSEVKTHTGLILQLAQALRDKFREIAMDAKHPRRNKRGLINGIGSIFKSITGNLDASDGEFYTNSINRLNNDEHQLENLLKNQISVTTSVIQNFNTTIRKLQIDEKTFNEDIRVIEKSITELNDRIAQVEAKLKFIEICEKLMESLLFIQENVDDALDSITFARLNIIHSSIITPDHLINALLEISQNLRRNNLPLQPKLDKIAQYLEIIELEAFQTEHNLIFVLKIPLTEPPIYTLYHVYPIPIFDDRTGLHHILQISQQYIAKDDDSLMFIPITDMSACKTLTFQTKLCYNMFAYPIDQNSICEAQIFKYTKNVPTNCQSSLFFSQNYKVHKIETNLWLVILSEPLQVTINCPEKKVKTELINKNSLITLETECSAFIGITKIQADSRFSKYSNISYGSHPVLIPYECCNNLPDKSNIPKLKPLKLNDLNVDDLEIAKHKLDSYSKTLDDLINQPYVTKHISWFTYFTITLIIVLIILYTFCKCRRRRRSSLAIADVNNPPPPPRPFRPFKRFTSMFPRRRPSLQDEIPEDEEITLNDY